MDNFLLDGSKVSKWAISFSGLKIRFHEACYAVLVCRKFSFESLNWNDVRAG
jgi:hypothetical protein